LWPYARADIQQMTAKIGLPMLTLPLLKMGALPTGFTISQNDPSKKSTSATS
jgi:preprotein translocase subunit SecB